MTAITKEKVVELREWLLERRYNSGVRQLESINDLLAILSDYEKMRAELLAAQATNAKNGAVIIEQMTELAKQAPLIEAVMGAELFPAPTDGRTCIDSHEKIIREALKLRGGEGK